MRLPRILALVALLAAPIARAEPAPWRDWGEFHRDFSAWSLDSTQTARVGSLLIERDACTLALEDGRLVLALPLGGRRVAAVFVGRGTMSFVPRSGIEQQQLRRFLGAPALRRPFRRLVMVFADSTLAELRASLAFTPDTAGAARAAWLAARQFLTVPGTRHVRPFELARMLAERDDDGLFWAMVSDARDANPVFFTLDPSSTERVRLDRRPKDDRFGLLELHNAETVSQFVAQGDPDTLRRDVNPPFDAPRVALDVAFAPDLDVTATADIDLVARRRTREWAAFVLAPALRIDEVSVPGRACRWAQDRNDPLVWVRIDPPVPADSAVSLRVRYHGVCMARGEGDRIALVRGWYPAPVANLQASWDVTFHHPAGLQVIGAGELVSRESRGGDVRSRWFSPGPVPWTSFDAGYYRGIRVTGDSLPPLVVWSEHVDGAGRVRDVPYATLAGSREHDERVAFDVARALRFYERAWGAPVARSFGAVETPLSVYVALPGLIRMMPARDQEVPGAENTPDLIRAHEIAHQWWGLGVVPATYHDRWLSEGFADFASLWYLQAARRDAKSYLTVLDRWRHALLENRHFLLGEGQQAGPIWLGPRTNSSTTPDDYDLVVYEKGAWVLHMLRNYLLRDDDPGETRFRGLLRDFYQRFAGTRAFTEDFRAAVERAAGEDMGWFFDQWVYGTDVPTYRFAWRAVAAEGGGWSVHGRVEQSNVPDAFRMPVLVRVTAADGTATRARVWVSGPVTEFDLPATASRPATVVFNDLESVLCEIAK